MTVGNYFLRKYIHQRESECTSVMSTAQLSWHAADHAFHVHISTSHQGSLVHVRHEQEQYDVPVNCVQFPGHTQ